ncbi:MAG: hypothetical protein K2O89_07055 [Clostridia bacterium]|nr:hypothetical protein [Clostridia bacterium]
MGDFVAEIVTLVAIAVILPLVFQLFYFLKSREEKKSGIDKLNRTRAPKALLWFFLGFALLGITVMIVAAAFMIRDREPVSAIIAIIIGFSLFSALGFFGFIWSRFRYEIIEDDGITLVRFNKRWKVYFSEIEYYKFTDGMAGGLIAYDKNGVVIFSAEAINIGSHKLVSAMQNNFVTEVFNGFPPAEMKKSKEYKTGQNKSGIIILSWTMFGLGVFILAVWGLIFSNASLHEFENYEVSGIVESYEFKEDTLTVKLVDDDGVYWVNNIVYDEMNKSVKKAIKENVGIDLLIGYKDDRERFNISQIKIDGEIYLNATDAEKSEKDNYDGTVTLCWVIFGISVAMLVTWAGLLIYKKVKFDGKEKEDGE